jgi:hypothetical protein
MSGTYSTDGRVKKFILCFGWKTWGEETALEDVGVDCKMILEWFLEKCDGRLWIGFVWLRMGTGVCLGQYCKLIVCSMGTKHNHPAPLRIHKYSRGFRHTYLSIEENSGIRLLSSRFPMIMYLRYLLTYLLTYSMVQNISWKSDCHSAYQKTSCFLYGTRRFITVFTKTRHWILSWTKRIQFASSIPISLRSILMLFSHLCEGHPSGLLPSGLPTKTL